MRSSSAEVLAGRMLVEVSSSNLREGPFVRSRPSRLLLLPLWITLPVVSREDAQPILDDVCIFCWKLNGMVFKMASEVNYVYLYDTIFHKIY